MKCFNCETELPDDAAFCASCGSRVAAPMPAPEEIAEPEEIAAPEEIAEPEEITAPEEAVVLEEAVIPETPVEAEQLGAPEAPVEPEAVPEPEIPVEAAVPAAPVVAAEPATPVGPACAKCRNPLKPGAKFCNVCGSPVSANPSPAPADAFCPRCGGKVKVGAAFCPSCGNRLQAAAPQAVSAFAPPAQQTQSQYRPQAYPQYAPSPQYAQAPNPYQQPPVRRKKKGALVAVILILVLAVVGVGVYALFGNQIKKTIMGPRASYLSIDGNALKKETADAVETLVKYGNKSSNEVGGFDMDLQITLDAASLELDPQLTALFENLRIKNSMMYDRSGDMPKVYDNLEILSLSEHLVNVEVLYNNDEMIIRAPEIFEQYLVATADELAGAFGSSGISVGEVDMSQFSALAGLLTGSGGADLGIDEDELNKTTYKIIDIILKHIDTCERTSGETLTAGSVSAEYDLYTMSISKESARAMFIEILETLKTDEEFYNLFSKLSVAFSSEAGVEGTELTFEQYQADIQTAIDEISDETNDTGDFTIHQLVYVNSKDEVVGRDLTVVDDTDATLMHFQYAQPADGSQEAYFIAFESGTDSFEFLADYTIAGGKKTGTALLSSMGTDVLSIDFADYVREETETSDKFFGHFDISIIDAASAAEGMPTEIVLDIKAEGDQTIYDISIPNMLNVHLGYSEIAENEVDIPSFDDGTRVSLSDSTAMSEVMTADAQAKITAIMEKLGVNTSETY